VCVGGGDWASAVGRCQLSSSPGSPLASADSVCALCTPARTPLPSGPPPPTHLRPQLRRMSADCRSMRASSARRQRWPKPPCSRWSCRHASRRPSPAPTHGRRRRPHMPHACSRRGVRVSASGGGGGGTQLASTAPSPAPPGLPPRRPLCSAAAPCPPALSACTHPAPRRRSTRAPPASRHGTVGGRGARLRRAAPPTAPAGPGNRGWPSLGSQSAGQACSTWQGSGFSDLPAAR
jgi:hypothetical protein